MSDNAEEQQPYATSSRVRGTTLVSGVRKDRLEAMHDAIYAVAMTLLVLDLHVPAGATTFRQFIQQLHGELPQFGAAAIAFIVVGLMWLNNYYRTSMVVRADFTHLALNLAGAGAIVLIPFSTRVLAEYWFYPWGIAIFSWNISLAIICYAFAAIHFVRFLIPKQVDQHFLKLNLAVMWSYALVSSVIVPALAFVSPLATIILIVVLAILNILAIVRMQPRFVAAHRIALSQSRDDVLLE